MSQSGMPPGPPPPSDPLPPSPDDPESPLPGDEPPHRRRGFVAGVTAAAIVVLVPGAAIAWQALSGGGSQPHDVLPGDAVGYVRVDLDPSASQKVEAFRFFDRFPIFDGSNDLSDDTDLRQWLVEQFADETECPLDFESDVEPWIGDRAGVAVLPPEGDDENPGVVLAVQADDEAAAEAALTTALSCGGEETDVGTTFVDGYLLVTDTAANAERYAESAGESSLADNDEYANAMNLLGDQGVMSAWFSGAGMSDMFSGGIDELADAAGSAPGAAAVPSADELRELVGDHYRSVALTLRFNEDYAEIASVVTGDAYEAVDGERVRADVPEDTTMLLGVANGGQQLRDNWASIEEMFPNASSSIAEFESATGLTLPDDISTALGQSLVVAFDATGLDVRSLMESGDVSSLDLGLKVVTDPEAFQDLWRSLGALAEDESVPLGSLPLEITDDGYVLATNPGYADALVDGGALEDSDAYTTAVNDAADADAVFYLNVDAVEEQLVSLGGGALSTAEQESIRELRALGFSTRVLDDHAEMTLRVSAG